MKMRAFLGAAFVALCFLGQTGCTEPAKQEITESAHADLDKLPEEANMFFFCDFEKINESEIGQVLVRDMRTNIDRDIRHSDFESFKEATGLDPFEDFKTILVAGKIKESRRNDDFAVILHGNFDEEKIMGFAREKLEEERRDIPWTTEELSGNTIYTIEKRDEVSFCFVNGSTVYLGSPDWVRAALENEGRGSSGSRESVTDALKNHIKYGDQFWMTVDAAAIDRQPMGRSLRENVPAAERIKSLYFSAQTSDRIDFAGKILCDDSQSSQLLVDMMRGALATAKLSVSKERSIVDELNNIEIFQDGSNAVLKGKITQELIKKIEDHRGIL